MEKKFFTLNKERNVSLTCYLQDVGGEFANISKRPAMIVLPGGGYQMCSDREADPVAFEYLRAGYQVFILRYSVGKHAIWPNPINDYDLAYEFISAHAEEWNVYTDKIAVVGFSAGGHMAASAATIAKNRPAAAILGYAVTEGETARMCNPSAPDLVSEIDADTPPCFLFATRTDAIVPVSNTIHFADALDKAGIMFETHIYSYGPHGFSTLTTSVEPNYKELTPRAARWVFDSIEWLKEVLGDFGSGQMTEPVVKGKVNGDFDEFLSVECTIGKLLSVPESAAILMPMLKEAQKKLAEENPDNPMMQVSDAQESQMQNALANKMKLSEALAFQNVGTEVIDSLNAQFSKIRNR